jgi:hypothetical protein
MVIGFGIIFAFEYYLPLSGFLYKDNFLFTLGQLLGLLPMLFAILQSKFRRSYAPPRRAQFEPIFMVTCCLALVFVIFSPNRLAATSMFSVSKGALEFFAGLGRVSVFISLVVVSAVPLSLLRSRMFDRVTDGLILYRLIVLMQLVEVHKSEWSEPGFKMKVFSELDRLSYYLADMLSRQYRTRDEMFNLWVTDRGKRMARYVRDLKKCVAMPRPDTQDAFLRAIVQMLTCAGAGVWDEFPTSDDDGAANERNRLGTVLHFLRNLVTALAPISVIMVLNRTGVKVPDPIGPYLALASLIWAVFGTISLLDPLFAARLETLRTATLLFPTLNKHD